MCPVFTEVQTLVAQERQAAFAQIQAIATQSSVPKKGPHKHSGCTAFYRFLATTKEKLED